MTKLYVDNLKQIPYKDIKRTGLWREKLAIESWFTDHT